MPSIAALAADGLLVLHFVFVAFVVGGEALVIAGGLASWAWVRNLRFRVCHLAAIGFVVVQAWAGRLCPLTLWENALRRAAGQRAYEESFIGHWLGRALYFDAPPWVFTLAYSLFGGLVLLTWVWVRPERRRDHASPSGV